MGHCIRIFRRSIPSFILISLFLAACYDPDDDTNFTVVDPTPHPTEVTIELDPDLDTVEVYGPVVFSYRVNGSEEIPSFTLTSNWEREEVFAVSNYDLVWKVPYTPKIDSGYVKAFVRVLTPSHTGSLADRLHQEHVVKEKSWIIKVYMKPPRPTTITSVAPKDGSMKITWTRNTQPNFYSYDVSREQDGITSFLGSIVDPDQTFFFDEEVIGNNATYVVTTRSIDQPPARAEKHFVESRPVKPLKAVHKGEVFELVWSSTPLYNNFASYEIYRGTDSLSTYEPIYTTTDPKDTTFSVPAQFGSRHYFSVQIRSKAPYQRVPLIKSGSLSYMLGEKIPTYEKILFSSSKGIYVTYTNSTITTYRISDNKMLGQERLGVPRYFVSMVMSNDGSLLYGLTETHLYWIEIETLTFYRHDVSSFLGLDHYRGLGEAPDGKILLSKTSGNFLGKLLFYDRALGTVVDEYSNMPASSKMQLSSDGNFVLCNEDPARILRLKADHTVEYVSVETFEGKIAFDPEGSGNVIVGLNPGSPNGAVLIRDPSTGNALSVRPTPKINVIDMDFVASRLVGSVEGGSTTVYDYRNLKELIRIGPANFNINLHGDYLYSPEGARLKVTP